MAFPSIRIPFGPQHPALKEPAYFMFEVEGERVVGVKPRIGYVHRGIEKALESRTFIQNLYLVERICGICSHAHTTSYTQAIEEMLGVEIPPRTKYIRTIVAELARIQDHLLGVAAAGLDLGGYTAFIYPFNAREHINDLFEEIWALASRRATRESAASPVTSSRSSRIGSGPG